MKLVDRIIKDAYECQTFTLAGHTYTLPTVAAVGDVVGVILPNGTTVEIPIVGPHRSSKTLVK